MRLTWKNWAGLVVFALSGFAQADGIPNEAALAGNWDCEYAFKTGDKFTISFSQSKFALKVANQNIDGVMIITDAGNTLQLNPTNTAQAATIANYLPAKVFQFNAPEELVLGDGSPETYCSKK